MSPKTILTSVSDDRFGRKGSKYSETQDKMYHIMKANPQLGIHDFKMWKWEDIEKTEFYKKNKLLLDNTDASRNGRAYKPFVIWEALSSANEGDYVIYNDCSPEIWDMGYDAKFQPIYFNLSVLHNLCKGNDDVLSVFVKWAPRKLHEWELGMHTHRHFTLKRCIDKMGMGEYTDSYMGASGMWVIRKTESAMQFVNDWLKWNTDPDCCSLGDINIPDDYSYWDEESHLEFGKPGYKMGHRHDQSIAGLLLNERKAKLVDILYNEISPYNFLQYTRTNENFKFIDSYAPLDHSDPINIDDVVVNEKGVLLRVYKIEGDQYIVGKSDGSMYATTKNTLTLKK
jgi:hypothetical protein